MDDSPEMDDRLQKALLRALGKEPSKCEHVDVAGKLAECGLLQHLHSDLWPPMGAVRELGGKLNGLKKSGVVKP